MVIKIAGRVWIKTALKPLAFLSSWLLVTASKSFQLVEGESGEISLCFPDGSAVLVAGESLLSVRGWRGWEGFGGGHSTKSQTVSIILSLCPGNLVLIKENLMFTAAIKGSIFKIFSLQPLPPQIICYIIPTGQEAAFTSLFFTF